MEFIIGSDFRDPKGLIKKYLDGIDLLCYAAALGLDFRGELTTSEQEEIVNRGLKWFLLFKDRITEEKSQITEWAVGNGDVEIISYMYSKMDEYDGQDYLVEVYDLTFFCHVDAKKKVMKYIIDLLSQDPFSLDTAIIKGRTHLALEFLKRGGVISERLYSSRTREIYYLALDGGEVDIHKLCHAANKGSDIRSFCLNHKNFDKVIYGNYVNQMCNPQYRYYKCHY